MSYADFVEHRGVLLRRWPPRDLDALVARICAVDARKKPPMDRLDVELCRTEPA